MTHEQFSEQNGSASQSPAAWTLRYPEESRTFLMHFGKDDRGISALRAYNEELIELADYCQGKSRHVFKGLLAWLEEDWEFVLERHQDKRQVDASAEEHTPDASDRVTEDANDSVTEVGWLSHAEEYDDGINGIGGIVAKLRRETGIAYLPEMFRRLEMAGHGPFALGASTRRRSVYMRWHASVFGATGEDWPVKFDELPATAENTSDLPTCLLVGEGCPDTANLHDHLSVWGAHVWPVESPLEGAQMVSRRDAIGLVVLAMQNVEAELVIADIAMRRGIPFLVVAYGGERPAALSLGGAVVRNPTSILEIRAGLASLPERHLRGLDLMAMPRRKRG